MDFWGFARILKIFKSNFYWGFQLLSSFATKTSSQPDQPKVCQKSSVNQGCIPYVFPTAENCHVKKIFHILSNVIDCQTSSALLHQVFLIQIGVQLESNFVTNKSDQAGQLKTKLCQNISTVHAKSQVK